MQFWINEVPFLSQVISPEGIAVEHSKVKGVLDWKPLTSVTRVRSFLGLAGYYRRFIPNFSKIVKPIIELLKKGTKYVWSEDCDDTFQTMKKLLTTSIKDYELKVHYHPNKANIVADVLSRKAYCNYLSIVPLTEEESSIRVLSDLLLYNITPTPLLREEINAAQKNDKGMTHLRRRLLEGDPKVNCFREDAEGILWFKDRLVVSKKESLKKKILGEAHTSRYSIHPGSTKIYHDLR
jgi:hypothetical protein